MKHISLKNGLLKEKTNNLEYEKKIQELNNIIKQLNEKKNNN